MFEGVITNILTEKRQKIAKFFIDYQKSLEILKQNRTI